MELGIKEDWFWQATIAEIEREVKAKTKILKREREEKAFYDYNLAQLIGVAFAGVYSEKAKFPLIEEAYPSIFQEQIDQIKQLEQKKADELSTMRFLQFANKLNKKKEVGNSE